MQSEMTLFRKLQEGDWEAFSSFFSSYAERLYLYAAGFVSDREEARDIVQDTFIYLWVNRAKIKCSGSLYAYLLRSVKNSCIDYRLHQKVREKYRKECVILKEETDDDDNLEHIYTRLRATIEALPSKCREIFILGCVEGMDYKEIADQLGISVNTVKTQIKVAYKKVRSELGDRNMLLVARLFPMFASEDYARV